MLEGREETCPKCGNPIKVYQWFMGGYSDYQDDFDYECEHCASVLKIQVETIPFFNINIKEER